MNVKTRKAKKQVNLKHRSINLLSRAVAGNNFYCRARPCPGAWPVLSV